MSLLFYPNRVVLTGALQNMHIYRRLSRYSSLEVNGNRYLIVRWWPYLRKIFSGYWYDISWFHLYASNNLKCYYILKWNSIWNYSFHINNSIKCAFYSYFIKNLISIPEKVVAFHDNKILCSLKYYSINICHHWLLWIW